MQWVVEPVERRIMLAITATFTPASNLLVVSGDAQDNAIIVSRNIAGSIFVNNGSVPIAGGSPTVANTQLIVVNGNDGKDLIVLEQLNGVMPSGQLIGGNQDDTLRGGSSPDSLFGQAGNDLLEGGSGVDSLLGGDGNDILLGGDGDDLVFGENDNDRMIWNPGDDTDLNEGGAGADTVEVNGGGGAETFTTTANGLRVRFDRLNPAPFSLDIGTSENLVLNANGGDDFSSATGNLAALIALLVDGGTGNDTLLGTNGIDTLFGGDGNDSIDGQQGNDLIYGGDNDDTIQWDPGDGSDTVEGQAGIDTLLFNGSGAGEIFDASANGSRLRFTRNVGSIVMDLDDVERVDLNAVGGADSIVVNDLTGTDVKQINVNLAATVGGNTGDAAIDTVIVNGTNTDDVFLLSLQAGDLFVSTQDLDVSIEYAEPTDIARVLGLGGDDIIDAASAGSGGPGLSLEGGLSNDTLLGGLGPDTLLGGDHDDVLIGGAAVDQLDGGTGENILIQSGSNVTSGVITLFGDANANTMTVSRDIAGALFLNGASIPGATVANTALIRIIGRGGADTITLNQSNGALPAAFIYGGTGNDTITGGSGADLIFGGGGADLQFGMGGSDWLFGGAENDTLAGGDADDLVFGETGTDRMVWNPGDDTDLNEGGGGIDTTEVNGGGGAEIFTTTANGARVRFDRLDPAPFSLDIGTTENLFLSANGGDDAFSATGNLAALISMTVDGGTGNDTLLGSNGVDVLIGSDGNDFIDGQQASDVLFGGDNDDTFQWDPGDGNDVIEGQDGSDRLVFNGSGAGEIIEASALGLRLRLTRNVGAVALDVDDVERVEINALGGTDTIIVNDLSGTDVTQLHASLAGTVNGNTGDAAIDDVIVNGTAAADNLSILSIGGNVTLIGLAPTVSIAVGEPTLDRLTLNALGGADAIDASAWLVNVIGFIADGGAGNDTILGSGGNDLLLGGSDADSLLGMAGADSLFGGDGNDTLLGGDDNDFLFGENDNDLMVWNPGDDTDLFEGGANTDVAEVNGSGAAEVFTAIANGLRVRFDRLDPAPFSLDIGTTESLQLNASGGDDSFSATGNLAALIAIAVDGGSGNDTLLGSNGADLLVGGDDNDFVDGQQGNDTVLLGSGNDTFQWDPGDGNDSVEGAAGNDSVVFNGSNAAENFQASPDGARVQFTRDVGNIVTLMHMVETLDLRAAGGTDTATINDLTGTGMTQINVNLSNPINTSTPDLVADAIIVNATSLNDTISIQGAGASATVTGLVTTVNISNMDAALDSLVVNSLAGDDQIDASHLQAGVIGLIVDGGNQNDTILGSTGADLLRGGDGNDLIRWMPGGGNDVIEGDANADTVEFHGGNANEVFNVLANGTRALLELNLNNVTLDINGIETVLVRPLGGADSVSVSHLAGTHVQQVKVDLQSGSGGSDGQTDSIVLGTTDSPQNISVTDTAEGTQVTGTSPTLVVSNADATLDSLRINGFNGTDQFTINQTGTAGAIRRLRVDGGAAVDAINIQETAANGLVTILSSGVGDDLVVVNTDNVGFAAAAFETSIRLDTLVIGNNGTATLLANGNRVLTVNNLTIQNGRLDLTNNAAVINYTGPSPVHQVRDLLQQGYAGGTWLGAGITSSLAAQTPHHAIGYGEASALGTSFMGQTVDSTSLLLRYTRYGDANLDTDADGIDVGAWAQNFSGALVGGTRLWTQGDWDYDGDVDGVDVGLWAQAFTGELGQSADTVLTSTPITEPARRQSVRSSLRAPGPA